MRVPQPRKEFTVTSTTASYSASARAGSSWLTAGRVFAFDAATCLAMGLALVLLSAPLATLFGLSPGLLFWAGVILFPSALLMAVAAWRPQRLWTLLVVIGNLAWIAASIAVLLLAAPTAIGGAFLIAQSAAVAVLAWLEGALGA